MTAISSSSEYWSISSSNMVTLSFLDVKNIYGYSGVSRPLNDIPKS